MDILSARKKAAERAARAGKKKDAPSAALVQAVAEEQPTEAEESPAPGRSAGRRFDPDAPGSRSSRTAGGSARGARCA